jgi:hypothetical protein
MKILSKHKDYYDYLTGIHGVDPVLYYDRRVLPSLDLSATMVSEDILYRTPIYVNNKYYTVYKYNSKYYHTPEELFNLFVIFRKKGETSLSVVGESIIRYHTKIHADMWSTTHRQGKPFSMKKEVDWLRMRSKEHWAEKNDRPTTLNIDHRQPVLVNTAGGLRIPILGSIAFHKVMSAQTVYEHISEFLGWLNDNPEAPQNTDNDSKIVMAGFDKKTSFRHRK